MHARTSSLRRIAAGITLGAALLTGPVAGAAGAAGPPSPTFTLDGGGTWQIRNFLGDAVVNGTGTLDTGRGGHARVVEVAAVVGPDDRSLPGPGACEGAITTVTAVVPGDGRLSMIGYGEVCGQHVQPPTSIVTHVFTGTFEVYGATKSARRLNGIDGFFEVRLADDGTAHVLAVDT
jgi:hypothetical protein